MTSVRVPAYAQSGIPGSCHVGASLDAGQEVPPRSSPGSGSADASIDLTTNVVHYTYTFKDLVGSAAAANVHHAPAGVNGPVVIPLAGPPRRSQGTMTGVVMVDHALAADVCANPRDYYINITSSAFADGEIRGQLHAV